jgi:hypothetical protein
MADEEFFPVLLTQFFRSGIVSVRGDIVNMEPNLAGVDTASLKITTKMREE